MPAAPRSTCGAPLRILHVASGDLWAGAEAMLKSLAQAQSQQANVSVSVVLLNEGRLADELRGCSDEVIVLPESSLNPLQLLARLVRVLRRLRPDLLHTHRIKEDILAGVANRLASRAICVRTVHGMDEGVSGRSRFKGRLIDSIHALCVGALFDSTFVVSAELCRLLHSRFPDRSVLFVPNGVSMPQGDSRARRCQSQVRHPAHVGIVGRLVPVKRVDLFLHVAALLRRSHPGAFRFSIYGDGPERARLQALADELQLRDSVHFAGFKSDMTSELAELDLLLLTSDAEGLPMVVLEAMAAGVPIISRAVGQIPDVLEDGLCGTLVTEQRAEAYVAAAIDYLTDRDTFALRAVRAAERVREHFSASACARAYVAHYRALLEKRRVASA